MTKIRISGVTDLGTARAVAALPVQYIALNITPTEERFVSPIKVPDYLQWLSGIEVVLQAHHLNAEQAQKIAGLLNVKHIELLAEKVEVSETEVKLWSYEGNEPTNLDAAFASSTTEATDLTEGSYYRIKELANKPQDASAFDINVQDFETPEGVDMEAVAQLVEALLN